MIKEIFELIMKMILEKWELFYYLIEKNFQVLK